MSQEAQEIKIVETKKVACDGDQGALGHPRIYLNMGEEGKIDCPYCDRRFILKDGPADK